MVRELACNLCVQSPMLQGSLVDTLKKASNAIYNDPKIALLGAMQSLFEGSMYTFVFLVRCSKYACSYLL